MATNEKLLEKIRAKMAEKEVRKSGGAGKEGMFNLSDEFAKVDEGVYKNEARMLPTSLDPAENNPFRDVHLHYFNFGGKRVSFVCPKETFSKKCAACDQINPLWDIVRDTGAKKGEPAYELAKSFFPTQRFYSPVIRRKGGKCVDGYKPEWYAYNDGKQTELMEWFNEEYIGDLTDPNEGRDLIITKKTNKAKGVDNTFGLVKQELHPAGVSKLGTKKEVQTLIDEIPDLMSLMTVWDSGKIEDFVNTLLESESEEEVTESKYGNNDSGADDIDNAFKNMKAE